MGGAYKPLMTFEIRMDGDWVEVEVPNEQPSFDYLPVRAKA